MAQYWLLSCTTFLGLPETGSYWRTPAQGPTDSFSWIIGCSVGTMVGRMVVGSSVGGVSTHVGVMPDDEGVDEDKIKEENGE